MKNLVKVVSTVALFSMGGIAVAEQCPDNLNVNETYDCIVVEAADSTFKAIDTQKEEQASSEQEQKAVEAKAQSLESHAGL